MFYLAQNGILNVVLLPMISHTLHWGGRQYPGGILSSEQCPVLIHLLL